MLSTTCYKLFIISRKIKVCTQSQTQHFVAFSYFILFAFSGEIVSEGLTLKLFEKMDLDDDGFVTEEEFVSVCKNDYTISKLLVDNINDMVNSDKSDSDSESQEPYYQVQQKY